MKYNKQIEKRIQYVIEKHKEELMKKPNVVGVAFGEKVVQGKPTGKPSLVIFVKKKLPLSSLRPTDVIEPEIEGVETDVVETGELVIHLNNTLLRPAIGGIL
jgi:hypothetical protein